MLCQDWANLEGSKLLELARHTVNITYRTVSARTFCCVYRGCFCLAWILSINNDLFLSGCRNPRIVVLKKIVAQLRGLDEPQKGDEKVCASTESMALDDEGLQEPGSCHQCFDFRYGFCWNTYMILALIGPYGKHTRPSRILP